MSEMQKEARENLVDAYILKDNELAGSVYIFRNPASQSFEIHVRFRLNGIGYKFTDK